MVLTKSGGGFYQTTRISLIYLKFARQNDEKGYQRPGNRVPFTLLRSGQCTQSAPTNVRSSVRLPVGRRNGRDRRPVEANFQYSDVSDRCSEIGGAALARHCAQPRVPILSVRGEGAAPSTAVLIKKRPSRHPRGMGVKDSFVTCFPTSALRVVSAGYHGARRLQTRW